jgi:predicted GH43/DUF377 family glycosyl hydrolase
MEPETEYEKDGLYKWGVVFPTGNVLVNDTLYVYYGASDQWCCVATANIHELVQFIKDNTDKDLAKIENNHQSKPQFVIN